MCFSNDRFRPKAAVETRMFQCLLSVKLACGLDIENCLHSGEAVNVIAIIEDSAVTKRISSSFTVGRGLFLALPDFRKTRAYVSYL